MPATDTYQYILDWIKDSNDARRQQNAFVERAILAYQGKPSKDKYQQRLQEAARLIKVDDKVKAEAIERSLKGINGKRNYTVHNAIETIVSMVQGGVGQYEFGPYDPDLNETPDIVDKLASAAKHFYDTQHIDSLLPQFIRNAPLRGSSYLYLKQKDNRKEVTILNSDQMILDPLRFKRNYSRFIGFSQNASLNEIRSRLTKSGSGYMLKALNEARVYLDEIVNLLNDNKYSAHGVGALTSDDLRKDVDIFYTPIQTNITTRRKDEPDYKYAGDEIEISYLWDLQQRRYFEVVNRRYVVADKAIDLKREIKIPYYDTDGKQKTKAKTVELEHPFIELDYLKTNWDQYATTPLFYLLDDFDDLCAMETLLDHTLSIMSPITFMGQSSDAEKVSQIASVSGEIIEGVPATFGVLNKAHDLTPLVSAIQRIEQHIKETLKATDPFEFQGMLGDRASAKEVASASGQVSQGLNPFLANIESAMAELGSKFLKMEVIFGKDTYSFDFNGKYSELSSADMAADFSIRAKLQTSIKLEQIQNANSAIQLLGVLGANEAIDKKEFFGTLIPIAMTSLVSRKKALAMVTEQYRPMPEEVIARIQKNAENLATMHPADKMDLSNMSNDELDQAITKMSSVVAQGGQPATPQGQVPPGQGQMPPQGQPGPAPEPDIPLTPETGGEAANQPEGNPFGTA